MGRGKGISAASGSSADSPRNVLRVELHCSRCGQRSAFDGNGGEWCPRCRSAEHLVKRERLYRLVELALD